MAEIKQTKTASATLLGISTELISNKKSRSIIFLVLSFVFILAINSVLPVIQGEAHYTAEEIEVTYREFKNMKQDNSNYQLTWSSKIRMANYIDKYINSHPELSEEEKMMVTVPDNFKVNVYTKFFYEYPFWYISTITSVGSAIILFYTLFNYLIIVAKESCKRYVEIEAQVDEMTDNYLDPVTFEPWMDNNFNYRRKVAQHKSNVKYEIDKIERKTSYTIKRKLRPYFDALADQRVDENGMRVNNPETILNELGKLSWRERRYLYEKEKYLALLDESYISNYVINGKVKHFKYIFPTFVYNGSNGLGKTVDSYSLIQSDSKKVTSDAANKITVSVIMTVLFAVLLTVTAVSSQEQAPFWVVVNAVSKIAPLFLQVPLAIDYSNHFMNDQLINNMISRRTIGLLYLAEHNTSAHTRIKQQIEKEGETRA